MVLIFHAQLKISSHCLHIGLIKLYFYTFYVLVFPHKKTSTSVFPSRFFNCIFISQPETTHGILSTLRKKWPKNKHKRTYFVQVPALSSLSSPVLISSSRCGNKSISLLSTGSLQDSETDRKKRTKKDRSCFCAWSLCVYLNVSVHTHVYCWTLTAYFSLA